MSRRYRDVGDILKKVVEQKVGLKTLVYSKKGGNLKRTYALTCETLKRFHVLKAALEGCDLWKELVSSSWTLIWSF